MKTKADAYFHQIKSPRLSSSDVRVFVRTTYEPAMRYSLPAIAIDEEELDSIQTRIIPTIVQKLGFSSKLPTAIRYEPISMGGLGLMDLRTECGIEMIKYFRHHVYCKTQVGELLIIQLKTMQLEAGIPQPLLEHPGLEIPYLTPTWISSMRQFLSNHNLTISVTDALRIVTLGTHDEFVMQPSRLSQYTASQQSDINLVRIYLQCTTLSDMRDHQDPRCITKGALSGERQSTFVTKCGWPRQEEPTSQQRRLWKRYISSQFLRYGTFWKRIPTDSLRDIKARRIKSSIEPLDGTNDVPFADMINSLPPYQRRLLTHINQCADDSAVWKASRSKGKITIASDGGLKDIRGTFGWTISTGDNTTLYEGAGPVDGPRDVANSTRCEIAGLAAPLLLLTLLVRHWGSKHKCKFRWVCDSKAALSTNVIKHTKVHEQCKQQPENADLLSQIRSMKRESGIRVSTKWIKGHQTRKPAGSKAHDVQRNHRADELATWFRDHRTSGQSRDKTDHVQAERVSVCINGIRQVGQVEACIRFHINGYHLRSYLQSKHRWSNDVWDMIDIKVLGQFCRSLIPAKQVAQTKLMYDQRHTGVRRNRVATIKDPSLTLCPCCQQTEETTDHVLQCKENPGRRSAIKGFRKSMDVLAWSDISHTNVEKSAFGLVHRGVR
ncbi:hypothetical protein MHU86_16654 [Fragilaria crotonensis]|nr:hypothetical protein MHU86_16654 [Fragilaria crotonensis]